MSPHDETSAEGAGDRFRDWDAAYVLGSLAPADRHEYEQHLATCADCRGALADLAGMPGLLASVVPSEAFALLGEQVEDAPPVHLLPELLARVDRARRRRRIFASAGILAVAAAVAVTLVVSLAAVPGQLAPAVTSAPTIASAEQVVLTAEGPSPLSAVAVLGAEPWGTRIDWTCTYEGQVGAGAPRSYAMLVTDRTGQATQVASWLSGPGTTATPTATTSIQRSDITAVSIVSGETGAVLLRSVLHAAG